MIESPLIQEIVDEAVADRSQDLILVVLKGRFGDAPADVEEKLRAVTEQRRLSELAQKAGNCTDIEAFRRALS